MFGILFLRVSKLYLKYIQVTNNLIKCYEHIAQPQKRILLRKFVDACICRVLELKQELVKLENSEFHFLDQILLSLRMVPQEMEIKIPEYFKEKSSDQMELGETVENNLYNLDQQAQQKYVVTEKMKYVRKAMVYIRLLQAHERTRQAREFFREQQKKYTAKELNKRRAARKELQLDKSRQDAAVTIQRAWRLCLLRRSLKDEYVTEMSFLGMLPREDYHLREDLEKDRLHIIKRNEEEYLKAKHTIKSELLVHKVPELMEELEDKIRSYFHNYFDLYGKYPEFPNEEYGGSTKMFELSVDLDVEEKETDETVETKSELSKEAPSEKSTKSSKTSKSKDDKDKKSEPDEPVGYSLKPSNCVQDLINLQEEYNTVWQGKKSVMYDRYDHEMLKQDIMKEIELEVRLVVDNKMRLELQRLVNAFQKDSKKKAKGKKGKEKKKGKGKGKGKEKKGKKKKVKTEKDLTPERTTESLLEELVAQGLIKSYPKYKLCDFVGDYNYSGSIQHFVGDSQNDPWPCLGDIRRVIKEYCILPMGSHEIHSKGTFARSVLIAGPDGVGKKSLVYAVCNEINATMIDLSAENLEGKYPDKEGKEMLLHLVLKVGRLLQPTIIFIKDAENYFYKKKPLTCTLSEPGRLKKDLPKFLKGIRSEDRILICGTATQPFDVDLKGLGSSYEKVICILKPDYNCRRILWKEMILKHKGLLTKKVDMSVLCNVSDGFTAASIEASVKSTLTERRLSYQNMIPLSAAEFLSGLSDYVPVYEEEIDAYKQWLDKMPLRKKRITLLEQEKEGEEQEESESEEED